MTQSFDILGFGEPLMELSAVTRHGEAFYLPGHGGDTSNTIIAAARQGAKTAYFTWMGDDAFGRDFLSLWDQEGVDRSTVLCPPGSRSGIYFISHGPNGHEFSYFRAGSAASLVTPADIPTDLIRHSKILHVSGISQGISQSACDAVFAAMATARSNETLISYDTNLRLRLWPLERARAIIHAALHNAYFALPGLDDAQQLTGLQRPEEICDLYLAFGCAVVALTMGKNGTMVATAHHRQVIPAYPVEALDATGAGDTFDGAFLANWLANGRDPFAAAAYANAAAALSTLGYGAVGPIPRQHDVKAFLQTQA